MKHWLIALMLALPISALACSDCEDEVCVVGVCACIPNVGRCPPPPIPSLERFSFCNITEDSPGQQAYCKNCSSHLSGDLGKADCLARHQGGYVKSGECQPGDCRTIASVSPAIIFGGGTKVATTTAAQASSVMPNLRKATKMTITSLTSEGKTAKASANILTVDGMQLTCSYAMTYASTKTGLRFTPKTETCGESK